MINLVRRLWFLFVVALKLNRTEPECQKLGPLVNAIRLKCSLLGFTADEEKVIDECNGKFSVVAGVRRQASFTMLYLMRCTNDYYSYNNGS